MRPQPRSFAGAPSAIAEALSSTASRDGGMTDHAISFAAPLLGLIRAGMKTQVRRLAASPLGMVTAGDRLWVQEPFAPLTFDDAGRRIEATSKTATLALMKDATIRDRSGSELPGPHDFSDGSFARAQWAPAAKMPRWASRLTLLVEEARIERLHAMSRDDAIAEGLRRWPAGIGGAWRLPRPHHRRLWLSPVAAQRRLWDATRGTPGERWADDPQVVVLHFRTVPSNIDRT
jgi:hypothetical protein